MTTRNGSTPPSKKEFVRNERLETLMRMHGWTQDKFAEAAGVSREHMNKLITGRLQAQSADVHHAIAKAIGASMDDIYSYLTGGIEAAELMRRVHTRAAPVSPPTKSGSGTYARPEAAAAGRAVNETPTPPSATRKSGTWND